ncbi:Regulator of nonsense transcripts upf2 [Orobanche minor]
MTMAFLKSIAVSTACAPAVEMLQQNKLLRWNSIFRELTCEFGSPSKHLSGKMLIACVNHQKDLNKSPKFVVLDIRACSTTVASLTAGLSRYHDDFAVAVANEVLEEVRVGFGYMLFLGELYNYEVVDPSVALDSLYLILSFGHGTTEYIFVELMPKIIGYSSVEEVSAALIELEELERRVSTGKAHSEKYSDEFWHSYLCIYSISSR